MESELVHGLIRQMIETRMAHRQAIQRILKQNNIEMTFEQLQIMHCLWKAEGVSQQFLAERTTKDKACLTNLINNLEKKSWVIRVEDAADKRNRLIFLTGEGKELAKKVMPLLDTIYAYLAKKMNKKRLQTSIDNLVMLNDTLNEI
ncbi:MAG: MarR family transcriptional regulator [Bacteroidaceae bacterium]